MCEMDEFYTKIQMLLMKKEREYGDELHYLTSRTTDSNIANIDDLCACVTEIFDKYIGSSEKDFKANQKCVLSFKYLLLNTKFKVQDYLAEDTVNGYLVDMCPPLSPYLLIYIIWKLQYDEILIHSLLFLPVQLCNEILDATRQCLKNLGFERVTNFLMSALQTIYNKFQLIKSTGVQIVDDASPSDVVNNLFVHFQEIAHLLTNPELLRFSDVPVLKKYERIGLLLKRSFIMVKKCLDHETQEIDVTRGIEKLYKITFGKVPFTMCEEMITEHCTLDMRQELVNLLLRQIKVIDCTIYLAWAELEYDKNSQISLQRSICIECYYFLEYINGFESLPQKDHIIQCLQHFSSKPDSKESKSALTLDEIKHNIREGRVQFMKDLINRYKEWGQSLDFINYVVEHKSLLDVRDCVILLEYLTFVIAHFSKIDLKETIYTTVTRIVLSQSIQNMFEIVVGYITKHDNQNWLETYNTENMFKSFITKNTNLRCARTLQTVLLFLLKSPEKVLTILVKISIGHYKYKNIIITADDMLLLSPIMSVHRTNNHTLLLKVLNCICTENVEWDMKKFSNFTNIMLSNFVIEPDDLLNQVFIPCLHGEMLNISNLNSILTNTHKILENCSSKLDSFNLLISLGKQISEIRRCATLSNYTRCELLTRMLRIVEYFLDEHSCYLDNDTKKAVVIEFEALLEPVDKPYFASLNMLTSEGLDVFDVIQNYERRCIITIRKMKEYKKLSKDVRDSIASLSFDYEDFLRHIIMRSTEAEYMRYGMEVCILHFRKFNWMDEIDAYNNYIRLTSECCCLYLEYPSIGPSDAFLFHVNCLVRLTKMFLELNCLEMSGIENICRSLMANFSLMNESAKLSRHSMLYTTFLTRMNHVSQRIPVVGTVQDLLDVLSEFESQCSELLAETQESDSSSREISRICFTHDFISNCIKIPAVKAYECINEMENSLFP